MSWFFRKKQEQIREERRAATALGAKMLGIEEDVECDGRLAVGTDIDGDSWLHPKNRFKGRIKDPMPSVLTKEQLNTLVNATCRSRATHQSDPLRKTLAETPSGEDVLKATQEEVNTEIEEAVKSVLLQPWDLVVKALEGEGLLLTTITEAKEKRARAITEAVGKAVHGPRYRLEQAVKILEAARILENEDSRGYDDEIPVCDTRALLGRVEGTIRKAVVELTQEDDRNGQ
jgi:hypothetical protein